VPGEEQDDRLTVAAIAVLAYVMADVAHEVVGHGAAFLLSGGRVCTFTTTRLLEAGGRGNGGNALWDLGGPCGNLVMAGISWLGLRTSHDSRTRLLWWLTLAFSLFWAFGYLLFCGVVGRGDWFALILGLPNVWLGRFALAVAGWLLYRWTVRLLGASLKWPARTVLTAYVAGGSIACAGAVFDPWGPMEMLNSGALSSFGAAVGLLWTPRWFSGERAEISHGMGWIISATVVSILYVWVLGPGIKLHF
jgi:hypothetical protein